MADITIEVKSSIKFLSREAFSNKEKFQLNDNSTYDSTLTSPRSKIEASWLRKYQSPACVYNLFLI